VLANLMSESSHYWICDADFCPKFCAE
jgi:hypothetical protein